LSRSLTCSTNTAGHKLPPQKLASGPARSTWAAAAARRTVGSSWPTHHDAPRGVWFTVTDDGPGFANPSDIWTVFGTTSKRSDPGLSGRFNFGEKQLFALARKAQVCTGLTCVTFENGRRDVQQFRKEQKAYPETIVSALMPWSRDDLRHVERWLRLARPPCGLKYFINEVEYGGERLPQFTTELVLPTVHLSDGVLCPTTRKARVVVLPPLDDDSAEPLLYELGIPVCELTDMGFPWSLDVQQKIPLPMSRDSVSPAYLYRLIGGVLRNAAEQDIRLLTPEEQGAPFIRGALEWIDDAQALSSTVADLFGEGAVRTSTDSQANAQAAAAGVALIPGRQFGPETRRRLDAYSVLPSARNVYGSPPPVRAIPETREICPTCRRPL
jgi:hypothetical protein